MSDLDDLMDFAARTARAAGELTLTHFGRTAVSFKGDGSEVTAADLAAEAHVRALVAEAFPDDGIMGEEDAETPSRSGRRWIIDPIDGTRSFGSGVPLYAVLLTLEADGRPLVGCAHYPGTGHTLVAARGAGAWLDGAAARVSECSELSAARVVTSGLEYWRDNASDAQREGWERLVRATRFARTWGDAFGYYLVATGRAELFADPICGKYWDYAPFQVIMPEAGARLTRFEPFQVIMPEAGARLTRFDGRPIGDGTSALASNGQLHDAARRILNGERLSF
jgi:histidinol-phosphatase